MYYAWNVNDPVAQLVQHSHSRHQKTTSNLLTNQFKRHIKSSMKYGH